MYLQIFEDGTIEQVNNLPPDVLPIVDNGVADFIRWNEDGFFERLTFNEPESGQGLHTAEWVDID